MVRISAATAAIMTVFVDISQSLQTNARVAPKFGYDHFLPMYQPTTLHYKVPILKAM
jgi:hypothetical protein